MYVKEKKIVDNNHCYYKYANLKHHNDFLLDFL